MKHPLRKFAFALALFAVFFGSQAAFAQDWVGGLTGDPTGTTPNGTCNGGPCPEEGSSAVSGRADLGVAQVSDTGLSGTDLRVTIGKIISAALSIIGVVMLGIMVYAGFTWMTAGGDSDKVSSAKSWIFGAVIGLAVILCAYAITQFVIASLLRATTSG